MVDCLFITLPTQSLWVHLGSHVQKWTQWFEISLQSSMYSGINITSWCYKKKTRSEWWSEGFPVKNEGILRGPASQRVFILLYDFDPLILRLPSVWRAYTRILLSSDLTERHRIRGCVVTSWGLAVAQVDVCADLKFAFASLQALGYHIQHGPGVS